MSESTTTTLRKYTTTFILDTRNYQDSVESLIARLTDVIVSIDGKVLRVDDLGQKEFERVTDRRFPAGLYVRFQVEAPADFSRTLSEKLRLDRTVNRILVQST